MDKIMAISSWSGGKDSCLACYKAREQGFQVNFLLNFISREYKRCCFHGIEGKLINLQAEAVGIPLVQKEVTADIQEYEKEFKAAVEELKAKGMSQMVFGDIYLDEHKDWVERVCADLKIQAIEPLWNRPPESVVEEFIALGFKAVVVSAKADIFGKDFVGQTIDQRLLKELKKKNICPCGENGEFHSFVVNGPMFKKRIEILESEPVLKKGFWKHWFLDIKQYRLI
jgi:uncharacterized protein (TIGR00290 family)